jgi:hypothetical protein
MENGIVKGSLAPREQMIMQEAQGERDAYNFIPSRIKLPSGGMMAFSTNDGEVLSSPFTAIIAVSQKARSFWPGTKTLGVPPLCSSTDGAQGFFDYSDRAKDQVKLAFALPVRHPALAQLKEARGPWDCTACALSKWGMGGARQYCKDLRRLLLLVDGWDMPAIMTVPPTSTRALDLYANALARKRGQAYFSVRTKFELEMAVSNDGIKYGKIKLSVVDSLNDSEVDAVLELRRRYSSLVREMEVGGDDYEIGDARQTIDSETVEILSGASTDIPF